MRGAMNGQGNGPTSSWVRLATWLIVAGFCLVALAPGGSTAAGAEDSPPEWGNATNATAGEIEITFYDNGRIDNTSISADDFAVNPGTVENISVSERYDVGDNRTAVDIEIILEEQLNEDNVTITFASGGGIADTDGNELTTGSRTVTGMDSIGPEFRSYTLGRVNNSTVEVHIAANEPLEEIRVNVTGPTQDTLTQADFRESGEDPLFYTAEYTFSQQGSYSFVWERATDRHGNPIPFSIMRQRYYDNDAPNVTLDGTYSASVEKPVTFSAGESVDEDGIESIQWRIDGGTVLSGETVEVAFAAAGSHEVVLEVTDTEGNTAVKRRIVQVSGTDSPVRISRQNASHATATVDGSGFVQQVRARNGTVVESSNVSLDRLDAAFPAGVNATLGMRATDRTPDSLAATGLGLFEITHADVPVDRVTFRFRVDRAALNRTGGEPDDVRLYRLDSGWTELDTTVVSRRPDSVVYAASSPGLSRFAVGVDAQSPVADSQPTPTETQTETPTDTDPVQTESQPSDATPDIVVSNVTVNETSPAVNDTVSITVTATNSGTAAGDREIPVVLNNTTLATHQLSVPAGETLTREYVHELPEAGQLTVAGRDVATVGGGGLLAAIPNPLALWPGGLVGTVLAALVGLSVVTYGGLKALAIYLGY